MSQFNFGSNAGANTSNTGFSFGGAAAAKPATPTFGSLGATQPSGSITFGTPIASVAPTPQNYGLSFGTPTLTGGTGLNFGTPASSAPSTALSFGTPAKPAGLNFGASPAQPGLNFAATSTSGTTPGLSFGTATTSAATGLSFGTPATSGGLPFAAPVANTGFSLGGTTTTTSAATPNPLGGINFGATPAASTAGGLSFSNPNPNPLGGINFAAPASSGGLTLGTSAPGTTGLSFGTTLPTASTGLNFGLGGAASSAATPTLNFKSSFTPASTATTGAGLNFGFNTPAKTQTTTALTLGAPPSSTPIGLGGVDSSLTKTGTVTTGRTDTLAAKENPIPNEILQSIESFKQFVKDQKAQSSDIARGSARPFVKVREDIDIINSVLTEVGNDLQRNQQQADKLKYDSAKCLHDAEMAQRTQDTPPGLQFENTAPLQYFMELVNQFEQDLHALRVQIDVTDKHFQSLHEPRFLTSQELATGMRRLHDTFVALAGRLHSVHTQVESHKEQYLNLRKYILKDPTNIFLKPENKEEAALETVLKGLSANKTVSGPTPFSSLGSPFGMSMIAQQQAATKPPPAYPATTTALNFGSNTSGASTSQLGVNQILFGTDTSGFQLQNPPLGNKRGKR